MSWLPCSHGDAVPVGPVDHGSGRWAHGGRFQWLLQRVLLWNRLDVLGEAAEVTIEVVDVSIDL
jgi:hypothetical protein